MIFRYYSGIGEYWERFPFYVEIGIFPQYSGYSRNKRETTDITTTIGNIARYTGIIHIIPVYYQILLILRYMCTITRDYGYITQKHQ